MKRAKELVRMEFDRSYKYRDTDTLSDIDIATKVSLNLFYRQNSPKVEGSSQKASMSTNMFDNLPALKPQDDKEPQDELDIFLSTKRDLNVTDGLRWWHDHKHHYPRLYRMALDYLSIPGK